MNKLKPNVLVIPIKYPVTTFQVQIELLNDTFNFRVLTGKRTPIGRKKFIKKKLTGNFVNSTTTYSTHTEFSYFYVNHLKGIIMRKFERQLLNEFDTVIKQAFEGEYPELIHIQRLSDTAVLACDWAEKNNVPVLMTEHVLFYPRTSDEYNKRKNRVYERVNRLLCVSNYLYRNLLTSGVDIPNCGIIGNLVKDTNLPDKFDLDEKNGKAIFVASHGHDKDVHVLLDAVKILKETEEDVIVDIYGLDNDSTIKVTGESATIQNVILKLGIQDCINIMGRTPHTTLLSKYHNYSFFISSSRSETFGISVAEAILHGLPVVCTDSGGIHEFAHKKNSIIVPIRDSKELAKAIITMSKSLVNYQPKEISNEIADKYGQVAFKEKIVSEYWNLLERTNTKISN